MWIRKSKLYLNERLRVQFNNSVTPGITTMIFKLYCIETNLVEL